MKEAHQEEKIDRKIRFPNKIKFLQIKISRC